MARKFNEGFESRVVFDGADVSSQLSSRVYRAGLARTFQGIRLVDELTVRENVMLGIDQLGGRSWRSRRSRRTEAVEAVDAALEQLEVAHVADALPSSLPYGQQRRVEIARAVAGRPRLLLLDEPVAGMSTGERREIAEVLLRLRDEGLTMLLIEHDLQFVLGLSSHLFVLNFGQLLAEGDPVRTAALPTVQEAFLGRKHVTA